MPTDSDGGIFHDASESIPLQLLFTCHDHEADSRSKAIVWNLPPKVTGWKVGTPIESDRSSSAVEIDDDWPELMLDPVLLLSEEIKMSAMKDHSSSIAALSETLKVACESKKVDKPKSELLN